MHAYSFRYENQGETPNSEDLPASPRPRKAAPQCAPPWLYKLEVASRREREGGSGCGPGNPGATVSEDSAYGSWPGPAEAARSARKKNTGSGFTDDNAPKLHESIIYRQFSSLNPGQLRLSLYSAIRARKKIQGVPKSDRSADKPD
ncbi:hypothetical protein KM043_006310 [Ampulex compressa]|nr:hypothetical protein KM043_006310 [Ampulex compressa]